MFGMRRMALNFVGKKQVSLHEISFSVLVIGNKIERNLKMEVYSKEKALKGSIDASYIILENILSGHCYIALPDGL